MGMVVQHNMNAINAYNRLNANVAGLKKASEKLASGYRINRAGDDAAGLAISEKMRSQIKGLNQAVRNSQDGINMIQTFEGAAQETHSILQRMKELAVESANGTYDNPTDRAAIELEFQQLNDELNQIADTDFNGTIVLNGGEMADGLLAEDGEFNYGNLSAQKEAAIAQIQAQIDANNAAQPKDIGAEYMDLTDLDDTTYTDTVATQLWTDLGLDSSKVKSIDLQFEATKNTDGTVDYKAVALKAYGEDADGNEIELDLEADLGITADALEKALAKIQVTSKSNGTDATGHGGFEFAASTGDVIANAIFDATQVETGDQINFHITGPADKMRAPSNFGVLDVYDADGAAGGDLSTVAPGAGVTVTSNPTIKAATGLTDANMTSDIADILNALNGMEITVNTVGGQTDTTGATFSVGGTNVTASGKFTINGKDVYITVANGSLKFSTVDGTNQADVDLFTIDTGKYTSTATGTTGFKFTVGWDAVIAPPAGAVPDVNVVEADLTAFDPSAANAALQAEIDKIKNGDPNASTKANAFENSTARMTYADHIILQTGARTKDAVDFTFNYNTDGSADMGNLVANLNLSSRKGGLETALLTLANQEDANYAIDQIDKAINKTSMVRATFGAIQNRLEHKITNLTTTAENLTEAESSIRDTDMASEMMNYTKYNILQQAAQSMLAQANQQPQSILQLLG